jgi:hypothetical protein
MNPLGREHVSLDEFIEQHQRRRAGADMICHGGDRQFDPLAPNNIAFIYTPLQLIFNCI